MGILLSLCIGVIARLDTGVPPGITPRPYAHLIGHPAPSVNVPGLSGSSVSSDSMAGRGPWLLFFTQSGCGACDATYDALRQATQQLPVLVIGVGSREALTEKLTQHKVVALAGFDSLGIVSDLYRVHSFPSAILVDQTGMVDDAKVGTRCLEQVLTTWQRNTGGAPR